jgi:hypothetical protein
MITKDTLLNAILAASGGKQVVMYDKKGKPSLMTRIPRFNLEDINSALGSGVHPAFIVNGAVKDEIYIGTYQAMLDEELAYSLPGQSPKVNINFDDAKAACVNKGPGFHLMTAWEWSAVSLWCLKNGTQPRGNTSNGKSHEAAWERGTPAQDNSAKTRAGTGPATWRHDGTNEGIADMTGNVWEWNDGMKLVDGRLYYPLDNNYILSETLWPASPIYLDASVGPGDGNGAAQSGVPSISDRITKYSETPNPSGGNDTRDLDYAASASESGWRSIGVATTFDNLSLADRQRAAQLLLTPRLTSSSDVMFPAAKGGIWVRNYGTRFMLRGGSYGDGAAAGLAACDLNNLRAPVSASVGFRPAFIL